MSDRAPVVSIVIPCYNKASYVQQAFDTLLNQTYKSWEAIVIDDASTDQSVAICKSFIAKDHRIRLIEQKENKGANFCRNVGISAARGRYIVFFDADDLLAEHCLERRVSYMEANEQLDVSVHTLQTFFLEIGDSAAIWRPKSSNILIDFLKHDLPFQTMQPIWKASFVAKCGGWDENFSRLQDVEWHTRVFLDENIKCDLVDAEPDCYFRIDELRKNFSNYRFYEKWINGACQYIKKYKEILPAKKLLYLHGTLFQTYVSLLLAHKEKKLDKSEFNALERTLFDSEKSGILMSISQKIILRGIKNYNLSAIRIPGLNTVIKKVFIAA